MAKNCHIDRSYSFNYCWCTWYAKRLRLGWWLYLYICNLQAVGDWTFYVVLIDLPKYMHDVLHVSVKDNGILTSLPWAFYIVLCLISGYISDMLVSSGRCGITTARKFMVTLASSVDGIFVLAAAYGGCDITLIGTFFTIAVGAKGLLSSSIYLISVDLSPNYAGILTGIYKTFSCFMGILVPLVISRLTPNVCLHAIQIHTVQMTIANKYNRFIVFISPPKRNGVRYFGSA